jgi:hypothetical protein
MVDKRDSVSGWHAMPRGGVAAGYPSAGICQNRSICGAGSFIFSGKMTVLGSKRDRFRPIVGVCRGDGAGAMQSLNPKVALFLAAVCAPFLAGAHPVWWPYAIWGGVVGWWSLWVLMLQWRPLQRGHQKAAPWIDTLFGIVLAILAVILIYHR